MVSATHVSEQARGREWKGYALVLAAATLWGTIGIFYNQVINVYGIPMLSAVLARGLTASLILFVSLGLFRRDLLRMRVRDIPFFAVTGFITVTLVFVLYAYAIMMVGMSVAAVLQYTAPVFVTIIAWRVYREPLDRFKITALVLCLCGVVLIARLYDPAGVRLNLAGILAGLSTGLTFSLYSILNKRAVHTYNPLTVATYTLGFGVLFLALIQLPAMITAVAAAPAAFPFILALAIGPTVGSQVLYLAGLQRVPASNASIVSTWEPVVATILAFLVRGERLDPPQIVGAVAILCGVAFLSQRGT